MRRAQTTADITDIGSGDSYGRERLATSSRWSILSRVRTEIPAGHVELGELCRVHRGQVTGGNRVWIENGRGTGLPESVLFPAVTRARELFNAGVVLEDLTSLKRVIDLPVDLDQVDAAARPSVKRFLSWAKSMGAHLGYVARHRKAWWSVGLRDPAPIIATYMARRSPAFVENRGGARHINIAHGIYPREPLPQHILSALVRYLAGCSQASRGRIYAGGLLKFEPREMERLPVPTPSMLLAELQA
jgi:hypothetical protein